MAAFNDPLGSCSYTKYKVLTETITRQFLIFPIKHIQHNTQVEFLMNGSRLHVIAAGIYIDVCTTANLFAVYHM